MKYNIPSKKTKSTSIIGIFNCLGSRFEVSLKLNQFSQNNVFRQTGESESLPIDSIFMHNADISC